MTSRSIAHASNELRSIPPREAISPGLLAPNGGRAPAFELKFLLSQDMAQQVEHWAAAHMVPDPHAEPDLGNAYRITSLYLDTPGFDVFHRSVPHHCKKLRLRGYGSSPTVFLEQKTRKRDRVRKRRTPIVETELDKIRHSCPERNWPGAWFHRRSIWRRLRPTIQIGCVRSAFFKNGTEEPMRLTLDRQLRAVPNDEWRLLPWQGGFPALAGQVVLELKYSNVLPALFERMVREMSLTPCPVSKYRLAMRAWCSVDGIGQTDSVRRVSLPCGLAEIGRSETLSSI